MLHLPMSSIIILFVVEVTKYHKFSKTSRSIHQESILLMLYLMGQKLHLQ